MCVGFFYTFVSMSAKNENTAAYILEIVSPLFNQKGYMGTSLSDLTKATGFTKGALYFHFKNKEALALEAFHFNLEKVIHPLRRQMAEKDTAPEKLAALTDYYRQYYDMAKARGGCPILNVGTDAKHNNPALYEASQNIAAKLIAGLEKVLKEGMVAKELKQDIDTAMKLGTNYPKGPFEFLDLFGIDLVYDQLLTLYHDTQEERYKICSLLKQEYLRSF